MSVSNSIQEYDLTTSFFRITESPASRNHWTDFIKNQEGPVVTERIVTVFCTIEVKTPHGLVGWSVANWRARANVGASTCGVMYLLNHQLSVRDAKVCRQPRRMSKGTICKASRFDTVYQPRG